MRLPAALAALALAAASALAGDPTPAELQRELDALQARLRELDARQTTLTDAQVQKTIETVLADAQRRSELFAVEGFTAGWDNGFVIRSADGRNSLKPGILWQFRHVADWREGGKSSGDDDLTKGFEIRRTQLFFEGTVCSPNLSYRFMWEAGKNGGLALQDAIVSYRFSPNWVFKVGQFFDPVSHELLAGPPRRLAVEPSVVDFLIGGGQEDRVQGASIIYGGYAKDNPLNVEVAVTDGAKSRNTGWQDVDSNWGAAARVESKCFGDWSSYRDFTASANKNDLLVFGAAADWTDSDNASTILATVDAQYETGKLAMYGALLGRYIDPRNTADDDEVFDYGGVAQAAYLFTQHCEGFLRYSLTEFDNPAPNVSDSIHEICVGANYYVVPTAPHRCKITVDVTYLPNGAPASLNGFGIAGGTEEDEIVVRAQVQLLI